MTNDVFHKSFNALEAYCRAEDFKGFDPFDALNSRFFQNLPIIKNNSFARLAWLQLFKRNPINLRNLFAVDKELNPKGVALFLSGYCNIYQKDRSPETLETIQFLAEKLINLRSEGFSGSCWGYNFDWQARAFFQPKFTPTVVATTYAACALLDAFAITQNTDYKDVACDAKHFVMNDLNRSQDADGDFAFSYSPQDRTQIFNASLLGTRLLSRVYELDRDETAIEAARRSASFCVKHQREDGAWSYGTLPFHSWIDNFHTGYNLECLAAYKNATGDDSFDVAIERGFKFYTENFFAAEGAPKYYNNSLYPIDPHNTAQLLITLSKLGKLKEDQTLAEKVLRWTIENMQNADGSFQYQHQKYFKNRTAYMRWTQSWMFYGMSEFLRSNSS